MFVSWGKSFSSISYLFSPKYYMNYPDIAVWQSSSHQSKPWQTKHIFRGQETSTQQPQTWEVGWNFCTSGITTNLLLELDAFPLMCIWKIWKLLDMYIGTFQTLSRKNNISQLMNSSQKIEYLPNIILIILQKWNTTL